MADDLRAHGEIGTAAWRTWGPKGLVRRAVFETRRRTGLVQHHEERWLGLRAKPRPLRRLGVTAPRSTPYDGPGAEMHESVDLGTTIRIYGGLDIPSPYPGGWNRHPLSGRAIDPGVHWSALSDSSPQDGDIKDVWEPGRLGWLHPILRAWSRTGDDVYAERIWEVIDDWMAANPPYMGPHWMCGQESSLRAINVMFLADALDSGPATTDARRLAVASLVQDTVGRVASTLGYALSQRNNHASSEAGFLWTASVLAPHLPGAESLRRRASMALSEVAVDQFAADGSYSQHSSTYQRVALHVLLWCLAVSRATGEEAPPGVFEAVGRSVGHLRSLVAPGSGGQVPNMGGNDGALVFDLTGASIADFRPVIAHAAAASGQESGFGSGPWDDEARWFGLEPAEGRGLPAPRTRNTHALTRGATHAVLRAGSLEHRPAHADQLHLDIWIDGTPVAVDPGSYRYTAPPPWGNALADEVVHNVPSVRGRPQAVRSGRFFWRCWSEARLDTTISSGRVVAVSARLDLPEGPRLQRLVVVRDRLVVVMDRCTGPQMQVRWNVPGPIEVTDFELGSRIQAPTWHAHLFHEGTIEVMKRTEDAPASGWHAPGYAVLEPLSALVVRAGIDSRVVTVFAANDDEADAVLVARRIGELPPQVSGPSEIEAALG